jgi:hypothetical protein
MSAGTKNLFEGSPRHNKPCCDLGNESEPLRKLLLTSKSGSLFKKQLWKWQTFLILLLILQPCLLAGEAVWPHSKRFIQLITQGDEWYARRAEGGVDDRALKGPIIRATTYYKSALQIARTPADRKKARLRLLEALYFRSCYATPDDALKLKLFQQGVEMSEQFQRSWPADPAGYYFYALFISLWAEEKGIITAIRDGVATKVRNATLKVIDLDPDYRNGGPWKVLAVLYHVSPPDSFSDSLGVFRFCRGVPGKSLANGPGRPSGQLFHGTPPGGNRA